MQPRACLALEFSISPAGISGGGGRQDFIFERREFFRRGVGANNLHLNVPCAFELFQDTGHNVNTRGRPVFFGLNFLDSHKNFLWGELLNAFK